MSFSSPTVVATDKVLLVSDALAAEEPAADEKVEWGVHGWNETGFNRRLKHTLCAYSVEDGRELWNAPSREGYNSPVDLFVVGDQVWVGSDYKCYDLMTGKEGRTIAWKGPNVGMAHPRCYRNKATERFIYTCRSGIEVVDLQEGCVGNNSWIRGTCQYGIMPANGLLYAPPHALSANDGTSLWNFTADGRIDSAPVFHQGYVLFGCADGWIYSLCASDGTLAWRFRAAPQERQAGVLDQLESVWPVHGAVQLQNDMLYAVAGFLGKKGVFLRVVSAKDGGKISEGTLDAMPVFDGMSAAGGKIYLSLENGVLECRGR
jgi:hypothetical protein